MRTLFIFAWAALSVGPLPRAFACGSVVYGVVWFGWFVRSPGAWAAAAPKVLSDGSYCLPFHRQLLTVFGRQAVLKLLLAEGEKLVLMAAFDDSAMGVFGLVSNLGSLVLRLIFAPVEEIAYAAFSKERGHAGQHLPLFRTLLCLQGLLGWMGLCFGPAFAEVAIRILYGKTWLDAGAARVLALYCILLFFMALNGVCEAFVHAVASPLWMSRMQGLSVGIFVALVSTALAGRSHGPIALVMANTLAMALRVALCALFLRSSEVGATWKDIRPPVRLYGLVAAAGAICWLAVPRLSGQDSVPWVAVGASVSLAAGLLAVIGYVSRRELRELVETARGAKKD